MPLHYGILSRYVSDTPQGTRPRDKADAARMGRGKLRYALDIHCPYISKRNPKDINRQAVFHRAAIRKGEQKSRKIHGVARNSLHKHFGQMESNARKRETHRGKNRRRNRGLPQIDRNAPEPQRLLNAAPPRAGVYRAFSARFKTGRLFLNIRKKPKSLGWQLSTVR